MNAETAYSVFKALSPKEQERMLLMLKNSNQEQKNDTEIYTDAYYRDLILKKFRNSKKIKNEINKR